MLLDLVLCFSPSLLYIFEVVFLTFDFVFLSISQVIGREDHLQNDLFRVSSGTLKLNM